MRVYITASNTNDPKEYLESLKRIITNIGHIPFCFVTDYTGDISPHTLMQSSQREILKSDAMLFDATTQTIRPSTGRMIELGIGYQAGKKIIVIAKEGTKIKDTLEGITNTIIFYNNLEDIQEPLRQALS